MKVSRVVLASVLLTFLAGVSSVVSQEKNSPTQVTYQYDPANQQTIRGWVAETRDFQCPVSGTMGSHITVKNELSSIEVHLAPASFMKQYEITIRKGDKVTVVGSNIIYDGKPALIAKSVIVDSDTYNFRDAKGKPLW